jgi:hypothetical protein
MNILSLVSQNLDNFYQIQTKCYRNSNTVFFSQFTELNEASHRNGFRREDLNTLPLRRRPRPQLQLRNCQPVGIANAKRQCGTRAGSSGAEAGVCKIFQDSLSHQMFSHIHGALNIDERKN